MPISTIPSTFPSHFPPKYYTKSKSLTNPPPKSHYLQNPSPKSNLFTSTQIKIKSFSPKHTKRSNSNFHHFDTYPDEDITSPSSNLVYSRLQRLVSEFRSLSEPVDRVRRLLEYATLLPKLGELTRLDENRVPGCAAQVWLEVEKDDVGKMRFGADSDSEITKGFCSCLIFLLDGASPHDVLKVKAEDLTDMNVGLPVRSRVNSWNNVLIGMQERTKSFATEREDIRLLEPFPPVVISADSVVGKGEVLVP